VSTPAGVALPPPLTEAEVRKLTQEDESLTYNDLKNYYVNDGPKAICMTREKEERRERNIDRITKKRREREKKGFPSPPALPL
jgi:hypothetical protein